MKSNKFLVVAILGLLSLPALAGNDNANPCGNNGNNCNQTANGGAGGNGTGIGVGVGVGYANSNSGALATGGTASATGGNASAIGGSSDVDVRNSSTNLNNNANTNVNNTSNVQGQLQGQDQKQNQSTSNANNSTNSVVVEGDNFEARRIPVNTAFAPSIAPTANCALSVSAGVSVIGFSGSFGKAYIDQNCANNEDIRNVALVLGDKDTAEQMKCESSEVYRKARSALGRHCPGYRLETADGTYTELHSEWVQKNAK
jgi:hypothetical protein